MQIVGIEAVHVRGIDEISIDCRLCANRPNFLVAPNGTGKSSLAAGFQSLNRNRLKLNASDYYGGEEHEDSRISLLLENGDKLTANQDKNEINKEFDTFVINSGLYAKQTSKYFNGRSISEATISIPDSIIVDKVPHAIKLDYKITEIREQFVPPLRRHLHNFKDIFNNRGFMDSVLSEQSCYKDIGQGRYAAAINDLNKLMINPGADSGDFDESPGMEKIRKVIPLTNIVNQLMTFFPGKQEYWLYLNSIQLNKFCSENKETVKAYIKRQAYNQSKNYLNSLLSSIDTTGRDVKAIEKDGKLVLRYPDRSEVSNGELDILKLATSLFCSRLKLKSRNCILFIDEVFDYLDDGNLLVAQHFLLKLMQEFKESGRSLYVVILTHMDPDLMKSYRFKIKHVFYFGKQYGGNISPGMRNLIRDRENCRKTVPSIYDSVSQFYLHFSEKEPPNAEDVINYLKRKGMSVNSTTVSAFSLEMDREMQAYLTGNEYDAAKVCCALRRAVEEYAYRSITDPIKQNEYLQIDTGTLDRFEFAESNGVEMPETMYILSSVYNSCMHFRNTSSDEALVYRKLNNVFVKSMIEDAYETARKMRPNE